MMDFWDSKADSVFEGDNGRCIYPLRDQFFVDSDGYEHYIFSKKMFNNPRYKIPQQDDKLFKKFLDGGSRSYPSDGNIPLDIVATETRIIINEIINIAANPESQFYEDANEVLKKGKYGFVRGCVKLYLRKYTTRDWRRKRFTDDIDFWIYKIALFEHVLKRNGWKKNSETKEWEKKVEWIDYDTKEQMFGHLIASNNLNQKMDFGNGAFLDGSCLKDIIKKKLTRGHDVDLSDIINVAMVQYNTKGKHKYDWKGAWEAIEEGANTRSSRTISNLISLCRYSYAIADYIERVGMAIKTYCESIFDKQEFTNDKLKSICRYSSHWMGYLINHGIESTRTMIYSYLTEQQNQKRLNSINLKQFADDVLQLINEKLNYLKVIVEIES